jgi:type IV secretory pathway VirB4 component
MLRLDKVIKPWKESAALNDHINLYGFWNETAFLTKSGDVGMVLRVPGVDYESLDRSEQGFQSRLQPLHRILLGQRAKLTSFRVRMAYKDHAPAAALSRCHVSLSFSLFRGRTPRAFT